MRLKIFLPLLSALFLVTMSSCLKDSCMETREYVVHKPIYKDSSEIHPQISVQAPRALENPGKIYTYGQYLFINELNEGVHVIDNSDPKNPIQTAYYDIPGNHDIAIKDGIMYANVYFDLVGINIQNIGAAEEVFRENFGIDPKQSPRSGEFIVGYIETDETVVLNCGDENFGQNIFFSDGFVLANADHSSSTGVTQSPTNGGVGGSTARFTFVGSNFYMVNECSMLVYNAENAASPTKAGEVNMGFGIETIFPYGEYLFIGANDGMHIYDNSSPLNPVHLSTYQHINSCDPVVVNGDKAFVTLRDGTGCQNFVNQLDVVDISDLRKPKRVKTYQMRHPIGMATAGNNLYLCDDKAGLHSYDISDVNKIDKNLLGKIDNIKPFDAILLNTNHLLVIGHDGFYQYDSTNPANLKLLSHIPVRLE